MYVIAWLFINVIALVVFLITPTKPERKITKTKTKTKTTLKLKLNNKSKQKSHKFIYSINCPVAYVYVSGCFFSEHSVEEEDIYLAQTV